MEQFATDQQSAYENFNEKIMSLIYHLVKAENSEEGVKDLIKDLETCIETIENMTDILSRRGASGRSFSEMEVYKKVEDGILDSIHKTNSHQLSVILNGGYKFKYYRIK